MPRPHLSRLLEPPRHGEDGDVPGWVMITVMSAGIVAILTAIAGPELARILQQALASVGG
ncbi:hypothetical protein [Aeromicrobium alkaliterrae]|uniref:DUF4244 domain-containing protein n=1 Tax=Aeromicrobium alkaliterrae TaxID=302168 RepID=A0ABP4VME3_9ACTN